MTEEQKAKKKTIYSRRTHGYNLDMVVVVVVVVVIVFVAVANIICMKMTIGM